MLAPLAIALLTKPAPLGELRASVAGNVRTYRLFLRGKRTPLAYPNRYPVNGPPGTPPTLTTRATPNGIVYGTISETGSGAVTVTENLAFIKDRNRFLSRKSETAHARGERVVFSPDQNFGGLILAGPGFLYERGRLTNLGPAWSVGFTPKGEVTGTVLVTEDGKPYAGPLPDALGTLYLQRFLWRGGRRVLTDWKPYTNG